MANEVSRAQALVHALSESEREFLRGMAAGEAQAIIAARLGLRDADAKALKQALMAKLKAEATADLVRIAIYADVARRD